MPTFHEEDLQAYLMTRPPGAWRPLPPVVCRDGFAMSVQASAGNYCAPRSDVGPWLSVEIGFPNRIEPLLWPYAEEPGAWTDTVYGCVPLALVAAVIELHGGREVPR